MARKHNVNEIELKIDEIQSFETESKEQVIKILWNSKIGWGEYTLYKTSEGEWKADSECMDRDEDKEFLKKLMEVFIDSIKIEG